MTSRHSTIPSQVIAVSSFGNGASAYIAANEGKMELPHETLISQFPARKAFALHIDYKVGGTFDGPLVVMFRLQGRGLISKIANLRMDLWKEKKKQFLGQYLDAVDGRFKDYEFFSDLEASGILVVEANSIAYQCHLPILVFGVGRVIHPESDPFIPSSH